VRGGRRAPGREGALERVPVRRRVPGKEEGAGVGGVRQERCQGGRH